MAADESREDQIRREVEAARARPTTKLPRSAPVGQPAPPTAARRALLTPVTATLGVGIVFGLVLVALAAYMLGRSSSGPQVVTSQDRPLAETKSAPGMKLPEKPVADPAAKEALSALKALESVTTVGVTYQEYMRRLGDAKIKLDQVSEQIKDPEIRTSVVIAMTFYQGTGQFWNAKIQKYDLRKALEPFAPTCQLIVDLFNRPLRGGTGLPPETLVYINLEVEGVQTMMSCASQKVAELSRMIERKAAPQPGQAT